jgi:hypothetical protein
VAGDFRHTGRMDYIVGNTGSNTLYQPNDQYPVYMTANDFEHDGHYVGIMSLCLPDQLGKKQEVPALSRDDITNQLKSMKRKFVDYKSYAVAGMDQVLSPEQRQGALRLKATTLQSCFLRNDGGGKFTLIPLPRLAQVSVINGMVVDDFDGDGNLDVLINGNDFGTAIGIGHYDAFNGLLLKGDGAGGFSPLTMQQSGICIPGNGKAVVKMRGANGDYLIAASQNKNVLKVYALNRSARNIALEPADAYAMILYKNGKTEKREFYYGSSFLSQSARFLTVDSTMASVTITDSRGRQRGLNLP